MPSSTQTLPPKENALFKRILKCYEQKQYKNGLKFSKQILGNPKFSEHGETQAMKGLILNCLGRKEEAYDYVRKGLRNDLRSHVCWHVYGLLQRSDKKYEEAIKCYRNALRWDKDNIQILRDLSLLQIQMRDVEGYKETRYTLFALRPTQRSSWIGFAMSYHLLRDYDMALKILGEFRETYEKTTYDFEHSELLLYQNLVIQESGNIEGALEHFDKYQEQICDKLTLLEVRGSLYLSLKRFDDANRIYEELIARNQENHDYYFKCLQTTNCSSREEKLEFYDKFKRLYPKAQAPQRLPLDIAQGSSFKTLADEYLRKSLRKGVPPLFVDLRSLYSDSDKVDILSELLQSYLTNLLQDKSFDKGGSLEPATAILWVYYYLAQHHDHRENYDEALAYVNDAIEHTPTLIELFLLKGKIYKHVGNMNEAIKCLDEAQSLDTADRYLNCKCAKYLLRANRISEAEEMCQKFTREGVPAMENLNEMQCMWFQTECALACKRKGQLGEALKKCIEVDRHFTDIIEDQFDFHTYCMRKMTLRSYVELLRLEDSLRSHPFYEKLAHGAIDIYLDLFDSPLPESSRDGDLNSENMDPSELKKLRNKQKKALRKAEQEKIQLQQVQARKELHNKVLKKNDEDLDVPLKEELHPEKLERPLDPLSEALKFIAPLQNLLGNKIETHVKAFEIYYRKGKPLLMLQCIKKCLKILGNEYPPSFHKLVSQFHYFIQDKPLAPTLQTVIARETHNLLGSNSANERNQSFVQNNSTSLEHLIIGCEIMARFEPSLMETALQKVIQLESPLTGVSIKNCSRVYDHLVGGVYGSNGYSIAKSYRQKCSKLFPLSFRFAESGNGNNS